MTLVISLWEKSKCYIYMLPFPWIRLTVPSLIRWNSAGEHQLTRPSYIIKEKDQNPKKI